MLKTLTLVAGVLATGLFVSSASAEVGRGGQPRCPEGTATFVETLTNDDLKEVFNDPQAKPCPEGTTPAYFVCSRLKKFDVMCLAAQKLEMVKKGK